MERRRPLKWVVPGVAVLLVPTLLRRCQASTPQVQQNTATSSRSREGQCVLFPRVHITIGGSAAVSPRAKIRRRSAPCVSRTAAPVRGGKAVGADACPTQAAKQGGGRTLSPTLQIHSAWRVVLASLGRTEWVRRLKQRRARGSPQRVALAHLVLRSRNQA